MVFDIDQSDHNQNYIQKDHRVDHSFTQGIIADDQISLLNRRTHFEDTRGCALENYCKL